MNELIIQADNLSKCYASVDALNNVSFSVKRGKIVGLLGPNGAGKTTLLKAILGLTPYAGSLSVLGMNPRTQRSKMMERMCFIADVAILPKWLGVSHAIDFVEGVHPQFDRNKALGFLKKTDIPMNAKVAHLSKGMVAQLHLALAMAINVELLVLDEPTLGLDIIYRKNFYQSLLNDYYDENRTIVITTHQVEEIESILTDVIMISHGKVILQESMESILNSYCLVLADSEQVSALRALNPVSEEQHLGGMRFLFKGVESEQLALLGKVETPSISDIFVAKVAGAAS